jgi:hypothetical protein
MSPTARADDDDVDIKNSKLPHLKALQPAGLQGQDQTGHSLTQAAVRALRA